MNVTGTPFTCLHPKLVVNPYTHEKINAPCGRCIACQSRKAARYETQIQLEAKNSFAVMFVTLTFANSHIPKLKAVPVSSESGFAENEYVFFDSETGEVVTQLFMLKRDLDRLRDKAFMFGYIPYLDKTYVQKFMKRLRKSLSQYSNEKIRYFVCGEYGPEHFRPHFHILLFLKSATFLNTTRKTLAKDFPQWTWQTSQEVRPDAPLSVLECAVRESWRFGSVDAQLAQGGCARYVASYVNGLGNLPKVLRVSQTKPFTAHSRFLGFEFCKEEREKVFSSTPESIVHRSLQLGSFRKEYVCPVSYTNVFFPRCKGYASKTHRERLFAYRLYLTIRKEYPELPLMDVSVEIVDMLMKYFSSGNDVGNLPAGFPPMLALVLCYFYKSINYSDLFPHNLQSEPSQSDIDSAINSVYRELCLSRHFLTFVCNGDYTQKATDLYVRKIEDFYAYLDRMKLARWYEEQQVYAEKDFAMDEGFAFFFDDMRFTDEELRSSLSYRSFLSKCKEKEYKLIKHKLQNDLNGLFNNI